MEDKIKNAYTVLSGGKKISSDGYIISSSHFNSITRDRFIAELSKNGIVWNGTDIPFNLLLQKEAAPNTNGADPAGISFQNDTTLAKGLSSNAAVGIDIQDIAELPSCADYWEDEFYKMHFSPEEIAYCLKKENPVQSFAGIYACKEALIKCNNELAWAQIKLSFNQQGRPVFGNYQVSISHSGHFAVAVACAYPQYEFAKENGIVSATKETVQPAVEADPANNKTTSKPGKLYPVAFVLMLGIIAYFIYRDFIAR